MVIKVFIFNPFQENTYILHDETNESVIIDAGCISDSEKKQLQQYILENNLTVKHLLNTHLHLDHQFGNKFIFDTYQIAPEAHHEDEFLLENVVAQARSYGFQINESAQKIGNYIDENQEIVFGNSILKVIHVPGHSPGHLAFYLEAEEAIFVGDVLFKGSIGRSDLPKGDFATLIRSIKNKLMPLPDSTVVYSGHGPITSIGDEKLNNPYL